MNNSIFVVCYRRIVKNITVIITKHQSFQIDLSTICHELRLILGLGLGNPRYRETSNISRTLVGNKIVDNSDVVGASPVGAAPTTSSFLT